MKTSDFKRLIKEAVREALKEELVELGKQRLQESAMPNYGMIDYLNPNLYPSQPYPNPGYNPYPGPTYSTANTPLSGDVKQNLMAKMGMIPNQMNSLNHLMPQGASPAITNPNNGTVPSAGGLGNILADVANEIRHDPAQIAHFRNIGAIEG